jgi:hypothetical protein
VLWSFAQVGQMNGAYDGALTREAARRCWVFKRRGKFFQNAARGLKSIALSQAMNAIEDFMQRRGETSGGSA